MNFVEAGFWFLSGFFVASWLAWRAQKRNREAFQPIRSAMIELINSIKDVTEVKITIADETEEEDPEPAPSSRPAKDLH